MIGVEQTRHHVHERRDCGLVSGREVCELPAEILAAFWCGDSGVVRVGLKNAPTSNVHSRDSLGVGVGVNLKVPHGSSDSHRRIG